MLYVQIAHLMPMSSGFRYCFPFWDSKTIFTGCLELVLEKHYTLLPKDGQTHMTIYNGLPPSCANNLKYIQLNYIPTEIDHEGELQSKFRFNFTDGTLFSEKSRVQNEGKYTIDAFEINCEDFKISFDSIEFNATVEKIGKNELPNLYVLVTYNLDNHTEGILHSAKFNGPIDKTSNGEPDVK